MRRNKTQSKSDSIDSNTKMADEDDLDAFFDEVSEVEASAVQEGNGEEKEQPRKEAPSADTLAVTATASDPATDSTNLPPAKRQKTSNAAPVRPKGVVVASSTSVVLPSKEREERAAEAESIINQQHLHQTQQNLQQHQMQHQQQHQRYNDQQSKSIMPIGPIGPAFPPGASMPAANNQALPGAGTDNNASGKTGGNSKKSIVRMAAGTKWVDPTLEEWPENDFRIFVGNLSNEVTDVQLYQHYSKYPSLAKAKVVRHNNNPEKSKGYGFVSLLDPLECARAIRETDQTWLGSRPIRVKRSDWQERDFKTVKKKQKKDMKLQKRMGKGF